MKARQACVQGLVDIMEQDTASTHRLTLDKGRRVTAPSSKTDRALRRAAMVKTDGLRMEEPRGRPTSQAAWIFQFKTHKPARRFGGRAGRGDTADCTRNQVSQLARQREREREREREGERRCQSAAVSCACTQKPSHSCSGRCRLRKSTRRVDGPTRTGFSQPRQGRRSPPPFSASRLAWLSWCHLAGGSLLCAAVCCFVPLLHTAVDCH